jgi:hypothetical protein
MSHVGEPYWGVVWILKQFQLLVKILATFEETRDGLIELRKDVVEVKDLVVELRARIEVLEAAGGATPEQLGELLAIAREAEAVADELVPDVVIEPEPE